MQYLTFNKKDLFKIEYHAIGDTWWQPLLSYGNCVWPM